MPNPNIAEAGKNTRFQKENTAAKDRGTKPSIHNYVRRLARMKVEGDGVAELDEIIANSPRIEEKIAAALWKKGMNGSLRTIKKLTRIVDGPTPTVAQVEWEKANGRYY